MKISNTITGKKEEFIPIKPGEVKMYSCGITVYDLSHIGHARQAIVSSMMIEYLKYRGYKVKYVRNYTDVDDKIIKRANEKGINALEFSKQMIEETEKDMKELHVLDADIKTKASEYILKIIDFIQKLIDKGYAYSTEKGDVYFAVKKFKEYGKLSHRNVEELLNGVRIELEEEKKDPIDFALWKSAKTGEISWESPWGLGRPGWHIECSAMILDTLGEQIDIHAGGRDLLFPHHENEVTQSESLTGKKLANYWSHCGLIKINGQKMSKSLGNSLTIRDVLKDYNYEVIKYLVHSKHYTTDIDINDDEFKIAEKHMYYFYNTIKEMEDYVKQNNGDRNGEQIQSGDISNIKSDFISAMDDDFNTVLAIANLHIVFKSINNLIKNIKKENKQFLANTLAKILEELKETYSVLGLFTQNSNEFISNIKNKHLDKLNINIETIIKKIEQRNKYKKEKNFEMADKIRNELEQLGIILKDNINGTVWDFKNLY